MHKKWRRIALVLSLTALPLLATGLYLAHGVWDRGLLRPVKPLPEAGRFQKAKSIAGEGVLRPADGPIPLWSSKYGREVCHLPPGTRVKLQKKWYAREERRFYYKVANGPCRGWIPADVVHVEEHPSEPAKLP